MCISQGSPENNRTNSVRVCVCVCVSTKWQNSGLGEESFCPTLSTSCQITACRVKSQSSSLHCIGPGQRPRPSEPSAQLWGPLSPLPHPSHTAAAASDPPGWANTQEVCSHLDGTLTSQENNPIWGCERKGKQAQVCGLRSVFGFFLESILRPTRTLSVSSAAGPTRPGLGDRSPVGTEPRCGWADREEHAHEHLLSCYKYHLETSDSM